MLATGGKSTKDKSGTDNPAIALLTVVGAKGPANVTIDEFTTIASVWTHNQFIEGPSIKGHALGLRIAAGNVPNFVDLESGGYGVMIQDYRNSTQTPTMANFATLANVLAGCITRVKPPTDTLTAAISIAHNMSYRPERSFGANFIVGGQGHDALWDGIEVRMQKQLGDWKNHSMVLRYGM